MPPYPLAVGEMNSPYATLRTPRLTVAFEQRLLGIAIGPTLEEETVTLFKK